MEKITKEYLLKDFKVLAIRGLARAEQGDLEEVAILFGKVKYIKDTLLRCFDYDIEIESKYLLSLYEELYFSF